MESRTRVVCELKALMTSVPILAYVDYEAPFELHVDTSTQDIGTVLCEKQNGKIRVISFESQSLTKVKMNYHTIKLEFMALKWSVTKKFSDYLYGHIIYCYD